MSWASGDGWASGGKGGKGGGTRGKVKDPSKTVWLGNIPEGTTFQELLELAREVGDAKWAEVFKGTAAVAFSSAEEAASATAALNGVVLGGYSLVADAWEKKAPTSAGDKGGAGKGGSWSKGGNDGGGGWKPQQPWGPQGTWQPHFEKKGWDKGWGGKGGGRARVRDPSKAVWVGNVPEGTTFQELLALAKSVGDAKWAEVFGKGGTAAIGFDSEESAAGAIPALNGAVLGSAAIIADAWEKKQR